MARLLKKESKKIGTAPGSLIFVGTQKSDNVSIDAIRYAPDSCEIFEDVSFSSAADYIKDGHITWFNINGLHDINVIASLGETFGIHPLIQEDILNTDQRPKFDESEGRLAFFLKMLRLNGESSLVEFEQVSIVIGPNFLMSFQEVKGDVFNSVRDRIINTTTKIRHRGSDYLAFALMDAIVDNYVITVEHLGGQIEDLVDDMLKSQSKKLLNRVNLYRRDINIYRRIIRPILEMVYQFEKTESTLLNPKTVPFIKDLEDHVKHTHEAIDIYKELLNDELGIFHMNMSNRLNDILRVLTIFSVVFIPLTFVAGVYGTNFEYLPELHYKYAYPLFWVLLIFIAAGMLYFFKNKKWL